jgi:hypothetical protein
VALGLLVGVAHPSLLLVQPFAVIHDTADRRFARRRHFDKVQTRFPRSAESIVLGYDTDLVIAFVDEPNVVGPDPSVNA